MLVSHEATYHSLSPFESVEAMDEATKHHRNAHKLSQTELDVLDVLSKHSCVYVGVSYLCKRSIGLLVGNSKRTVVRACNRLEDLGIIQQHGMNRFTGDRKQTSNAVVIAPIVMPVIPVMPVTPKKGREESSYPISRQVSRANGRSKTQGVTHEMSHQKAKSSIKLIPSNTERDTGSAPGLVKVSMELATPTNALKNSMPTAIYDALSPFYDYDGLYKAYGVLLRAKASIDRTITVEDNAETFTGIFDNAVRKMKRGKVSMDKLNGYLYAAWKEACVVIDRQRISTLGISKLSYDPYGGEVNA